MAVNVITVAHGRAAAEALRDVVAEAKAVDPLAPVTVVVPTNYVGVAARRWLATGTLGPTSRVGVGIAGVTFLTVYRLAELLGGPRLAGGGRRPVSTPVIAAAFRQVLARDAGVFTTVAHHSATEEALVAAYRELSACTDDELRALARASRRAGDVVRICGEARTQLRAAWYDEHDLTDAARATVEEGASFLADLGAVVLYLPDDMPMSATALLLALAATAPLTIISALTGDARADTPLHRSLARLGVAADAGVVVQAPHGTRVVSVSDPDDEVRAVVRMVVAATRDGVALERMAILYASPDPYARLVHEQLTAAGIPHNGAAVRPLAESVLGRALLGLLALPDRQFHRHDVMALLASAPVQFRGRATPAARWERISREAGIVRGVAQWETRLARHASAVARALEEERSVPDRDPYPERYERELEATRSLADFITSLARALDVGPSLGWRALARWAHGLVRDFLASEARRASWPPVEQEAAQKIDAALDRLAALDAVEDAPGIDVFRRTLELELAADLGRVGRLGDGVLMGHVALGTGLDLDRVFVCGLAEGSCPARVRDDSLLPDTERRAVGDVLALRADRVHRDHRHLLAALASARDGRVLLFPRGDLRRTIERMPSRFLLDTVAALDDVPRAHASLDGLVGDWYTLEPSFAAGIARTSFPATEQEHRMRVLTAFAGNGRALRDHPVDLQDRVLERGFECLDARASRSFTRFDGNLAAVVQSGVVDVAVAVSPTRLERWANCPFESLMEHVLRVEIPLPPDEVYEMSPLDRGSLVHEILEQFFRAVLARPTGPPAPESAWSADDRGRLRTIAERHCDEYEARGLTGRRLFWRRDRRRILADLDRFLDEDAAVREGFALRTVATELRFGLPGSSQPAVELTLSDGRTLRFRGAADRVDRTAGGELWVIDYKTGWSYGLDADDPTSRGTRLQLPVYAHAARAAFGDATTPVGAAYWFVSARGGFRWCELPLTGEVAARFDEVTRAIVDGMERGMFPCRVDPPSTRDWRRRSYVDPDARGTRDRSREWMRKRHDPALRGYVALAEPGTLADDA